VLRRDITAAAQYCLRTNGVELRVILEAHLFLAYF